MTVTSTLPDPSTKKLMRDNNPASQLVAEALDNKLLQYARADQPFTITEVRDYLLQLPELAGISSNNLRYRVRDRLNTLERSELAERAGMLGKRRILYRLTLENPEAEAIGLPEVAASSSAVSDGMAEYIAGERDRLRSEMQVALGEAEHYRAMLEQFPAEREQIAPLLDTAIERGSRLKGQWDANTKLRTMLRGKEVEA